MASPPSSANPWYPSPSSAPPANQWNSSPPQQPAPSSVNPFYPSPSQPIDSHSTYPPSAAILSSDNGPSRSNSTTNLLEQAQKVEQAEESAEVKELTQCANSSTGMKLFLLSLKIPIPFFGGIKIYIHWSMLLLMLYIFYLIYQIHTSIGKFFALSIGFIIISVFSVFIHELGHALAFYYIYNVPLKMVALHFLGGFTLPKQTLEDKKANIAIVSGMGPLFNFLLVAIFAIPYAATRNEYGIWSYLVFFGFYYNVVLGIFNLLPIFPMDGGKVLRSLALLCMPEKSAVYASLVISLICIVGVLIYTFVAKDYSILILIPIFLVTIYYEFKRVQSMPSPPPPDTQTPVPVQSSPSSKV